jgi:hypothetical protein
MRSYADQHFWDLISLLYDRLGPGELPEVVPVSPDPIEPERVAEKLAGNVKLTALVLGERDVGYLFALQPTLATTRKHLSAREEQRRHGVDYFVECYEAIRRRVAAIRAPGFLYTDLSGVFDDRPSSEEIFLDSYHFGNRGSQDVAHRLYRELRPILAGAAAVDDAAVEGPREDAARRDAPGRRLGTVPSPPGSP